MSFISVVPGFIGPSKAQCIPRKMVLRGIMTVLEANYIALESEVVFSLPVPADDTAYIPTDPTYASRLTINLLRIHGSHKYICTLMYCR